MNKIVNGNFYLNRDEVLDDAIFLALCGLDQVRDNLKITGLVRLEMAYHKFGLAIEKLKKDSEKDLK